MKEHGEFKAQLMAAANFQARSDGRKWLTDRVAAFGDLIDLERPYHPPGSFEEPLRVQ